MSAHAAVPEWLPPVRGRITLAYVLLALAFSTAAAIPGLRPFADGSQTDTSRTTLVWGTIYVLAALALVARPGELLSLPLNGKLIWAVVLLACASALWSDVPGTTLRTGGELFLTTFFAMFVASRISGRDIVHVLSWALLAIGLASATVALAMPAIGRDHVRGDAWSGLFSTKNELGRVMALAVAVWLLRYLERDGRRLVAGAAVAFCGALVLLSQSKTALVVLACIAALMPLLYALRSRPRLIAPSLAAFLLAGAALAYWLESSSVLARFSDASAFTGRGGIWAAAWAAIHDHPWLGHGLGAFWRGLDGPSALVWSSTRVQTPHAHNGFLDLGLNLGLVGVLLMAAALVVAFRRALVVMVEANGVARLWPVVFLSFLLLYNATESTLLSPNSLFWILLCVVALQPVALAIGEVAPRAGRIWSPGMGWQRP